MNVLRFDLPMTEARALLKELDGDPLTTNEQFAVVSLTEFLRENTAPKRRTKETKP